MAVEAVRNPATLPITIFRVPDDLAQLRFCRGISVDRVVFSMSAEQDDTILSIFDRRAEIQAELAR